MFNIPAPTNIISRHRLPAPYRALLTVFWALPSVLFIAALLLSRGMEAFVGLLDPRFLLVIVLGALPALYVWQEGIDRRPDGLVRRTHILRFYPYAQLSGWHVKSASSDNLTERRILIVYDDGQRVAMEYRAAHLTHFPVLLTAVQNQLPERNAVVVNW